MSATNKLPNICIQEPRAFWLLAPALAVLVLASFAPDVQAIIARDYGQAFRDHLPVVRRCAGDRRGHVVLEISVAPSGRLHKSKVLAGSSNTMRAVGACVLRHAASWSFPESSTGGGGRYRIVVGDEISVRPGS